MNICGVRSSTRLRSLRCRTTPTTDARRSGDACPMRKRCPTRAPPRPQPPRQHVVDDHHRVLRFVVGEESPFDELHAERLEEPRRNRPRVGLRRAAVAGAGAPSSAYVRPQFGKSSYGRWLMAPAPVTPGSAASRRRSSPAAARTASVLPIAALRKGHAERQMAIRPEAGIDPLHFDERAHQQAGADEQHDAQRDLHDHQRGAGAVAHRRGMVDRHARLERAVRAPAPEQLGRRREGEQHAPHDARCASVNAKTVRSIRDAPMRLSDSGASASSTRSPT